MLNRHTIFMLSSYSVHVQQIQLKALDTLHTFQLTRTKWQKLSTYMSNSNKPTWGTGYLWFLAFPIEWECLAIQLLPFTIKEQRRREQKLKRKILYKPQTRTTWNQIWFLNQQRSFTASSWQCHLQPPDATCMAVLQSGESLKGYFNLQKVLDFYCLNNLRSDGWVGHLQVKRSKIHDNCNLATKDKAEGQEALWNESNRNDTNV